ncbi:beta-lactamase family protein [Acetobacteraceae bacterium H6797]|nr:beta-lactamase family protein [Acetobacteraceae bacterium H6797]
MALDWGAAAACAEAEVAAWGEGLAPGGAILAFDAAGIRVEAAGGVESLATLAPFTGDTVVRYASVTKHFLAALALREGLVMEEPLGRHLPGLSVLMAAVTLGRALDMTGGLPDLRETLSLLGVSVHAASEPGPLLDFLGRHGALNFPAGSEISYSNTGYRLVETLLARKGAGFDDFVREIGGRLGVAFRAPETWFDAVPNLAPGYWKGAAGWQLGTAGLHLSASGSLTGSARSLAVWAQSLLADRGPGEGVLARQGAERQLADGRATGYGLGLARNRLGKVALIGHGGSHVGYKTYLLLAPEAGVGVVVVANREDVASYGLAQKVMAALLGEALPRPAARLPEGLFAMPGTPFWLEVKGSTATYLGAGEGLFEGGDGWAVSLSAHLPMRLRAEAGAIRGEIGHVARHFLPVKPEGDAAALRGEWLCPGEGARFTIERDRLAWGIGPLRQEALLRPLGEGRFLVEARDGPWEKRFCLFPEAGGLRLVGNRSRVMRFERA